MAVRRTEGQEQRKYCIVITLLARELVSIDMQDTNIEAWLNQALDALDREDYIAASEVCVRALEIDPNNPDALFVSALLNVKLGHIEEALNILRTTLDTAPDHEASRQLLNELASQLSLTTETTPAASVPPSAASTVAAEASPIAFICGCGHSGTTLIANMLRMHPEIYVPTYETNMFLQASAWQQEYVRLEKAATAHGARLIVEKTPKHIRHLDHIRQVFPNAKTIIPVRDPRDVATSIAVRDGSVTQGVERWIKDNAIAAAQAGRADVLIYRHEDLITDPQGTLKRICRFLGVPYEDRLLEYHQHPTNWFGESHIEKGSGVGTKEHKKLRNWQVNQPIFDNRGRWRTDLPEEQVEELKTRLADPRIEPLLKRLGYGDVIDTRDATPRVNGKTQERKTTKTRHTATAPRLPFEKRHFSQYGEDIQVISHFLNRPRAGFYVDVGAFHPFKYSNTALLYLSGWRGINIDPATRSIEALRTHRPEDVCLRYAIGQHDGTVRFFESNRGTVSTLSERHRDKWLRRGEPYAEVQVPAARLETLLEEHVPEGTTIDFMNIDVEDTEMDVLQSNDWQRFCPQVLAIEIHDLDLLNAKANPVAAFLVDRGYRLEAFTKPTAIFLRTS